MNKPKKRKAGRPPTLSSTGTKARITVRLGDESALLADLVHAGEGTSVEILRRLIREEHARYTWS